jgi:hypothetical protein
VLQAVQIFSIAADIYYKEKIILHLFINRKKHCFELFKTNSTFKEVFYKFFVFSLIGKLKQTNINNSVLY